MPKDKDVKNEIIPDLKNSINNLKANIRNKANKISNPTGGDFDPELFTYGPPVSPKDFIESREYFGNCETHQVYPWVIETLEEIFSGPYHAPKYTTAAIIAGKGSGKSYVASMVNTYMWYWILSFKSFSKFLKQKSDVNFDPTTTIQLVGMAKTARQAKEIVFDQTSKFMYHVKAFRDRNWLPEPNIKSELQYQVADENNPEVKHKKIIIAPGNSSETFMLGFAVFGGTIDEAAYFREKLNDPVKNIYSELNTRRQTRFQNNGLVVLISSARADGDFIESFEEEARTNPLIFFLRKSTYDCKPEYFFKPRFELKVHHEKSDGTIEQLTLHPPEELKHFYEKNKDEALKDWDAIPAVAGDPFYRDFTLLLSKINRNRVDPAPDKGMDKSETPLDIYTALPPDFKGSPTGTYKVHVDLAKGNMVKGQCGCGFALAHKVADAELGFKVVVDLAVRFKVTSGKELEVNEILNFIKDLKEVKGFNITEATFDEYNSLGPIQTINSWGCGIKADKLSVGYKEHTFLKTCFYSGQLDIFNDTNLLFELKRLEDYQTTIEPGVNSYKDEADAVAGAVYSAAALEETKGEAPLKPRVSTGVMVGRGGAGQAPGMPRQVGIYKNPTSIPKYYQ